jgi:ATP-binding cassette subfamily F protein 3
VISQEKDIRMGFLRQDIDFEQGRELSLRKPMYFTEIKIVEKNLKKSIIN